MTEPAGVPPELRDSPGALIRAAREKQGLHIAALAASIKVSPRKLEALENDRWHELPDATFCRALAQTVCRSLKTDPRPILERMPPADSGSLEQVAGTLNTPFHDGQGRAGAAVPASAIRPMVWASGLLAVAAVVVYFLPPNGWGGGTQPQPVPGLAEPLLPPASLSASDAASAPDLLDPAASAPLLSESLVVEPAATGAGPSVTDLATAAPSAAAPLAPDSAPVAAPMAGVVQLRARDDSWVEARDANDQLLLSRVVQAGESLGLDGPLPIRLVIGNATATELAFRGRPVDLTSLTRNNVARVVLR